MPVALALLSGLSRADLRAITWLEVDFEAGMIRRPRHKTGTRLHVPMSEPLREILQRHRRRSGPVCRGLPRSDSSLYKALHRLQDRAEVPRSGWHQLRHTAATLLAAEGADVATIGRMLGHRPGSVVTLRYLHTDDQRLKQAADAVAAALAQSTPSNGRSGIDGGSQHTSPLVPGERSPGEHSRHDPGLEALQVAAPA